VTLKVIQLLLAAQCTIGAAWIGETLVHIPFTSGPHIPGRALTLEPAHAVHAHPAVVASVRCAVVVVDITQVA